LRARRRPAEPGDTGWITLRLPYREPMHVHGVLDFLGAHAVPGRETYADGVLTRALSAPGGPALVRLSAGTGAVTCSVRLSAHRDLVAVVARVRRLLDLDADPVAADEVLGRDPHLAPLVRKRPGLRSPGTSDGFETAVATVVGQQVSVAGARTVLGRIVAALGEPVPGEDWRLFPAPRTLAEADPASLPLPRARARCVTALARAVAGGELDLDPGADRDDIRARLLALPGIGPWTADYLRMRAVADPDVLLTSDLVVRRAATELGVDLTDGAPQWAPWRSYATHHLWAHLYGDLWSAKP
jgi:AraC family transcriptional regulator of adaptative response / DNA-3-methyladenine glycosylase II